MSCTCIHCEGDSYHREQMEIADKDSYMENKPPSVYEKLQYLEIEPNPCKQAKLIEEIQSAINSIDNELIALTLELPTKQAEKLLAIQERLY